MVKKNPDGRLILSLAYPGQSAKTYVDRHCRTENGELKVVFHRGMFYRWNQTHWIELSQATVTKKIRAFLDRAVVASAPGVYDPFPTNKGNVGEVIAALQSELLLDDRINPPAWLDGNDNPRAAELIAFDNGLLHWPTRKRYGHDPALFNLHSLPYGYDRRAPDPERWLEFLDELWPRDRESQDTLAEIFGYILSGDTSQHKIFLIVGPPRAGKGVMTRVLTELVGKENIANPTLQTLTSHFGMWPLIGKSVAVISDARISRNADKAVLTERLLSISGEDDLTIDRKYLTHWTGRFPARLLIATNELPAMAETSGALSKRFIILRLTQTFYDNEDTTLTKKLLRELPGILLWALDGLDRLQKRGHFIEPKSSGSVRDELQELITPLAGFLSERCDIGPQLRVYTDDLYDAYQTWAQLSGIEHPMSLITFAKDLRANVKGIERRQDNAGRFYEGVGLKKDANRHQPVGQHRRSQESIYGSHNRAQPVGSGERPKRFHFPLPIVEPTLRKLKEIREEIDKDARNRRRL